MLAGKNFTIFDQYSLGTSKPFYVEGVRQAHQILGDPKLSTEHKYYIRGNSRSATLPETYVNPVWTTSMAVDFD